MQMTSLYSVFNISFEANDSLHGPENAGTDALQFHYPADAQINEAQLIITFVHFNAESLKHMGFNNIELIQYTKTTFLGTAKPASNHVKRRILGEESAGELIHTKIPVDSDIEIHLIGLSDQSKMAIAFKAICNEQSQKIETMISSIIESIRLSH